MVNNFSRKCVSTILEDGLKWHPLLYTMELLCLPLFQPLQYGVVDGHLNGTGAV